MTEIERRMEALEDTLRELEEDVFEHKVSTLIILALLMVIAVGYMTS